MNPLSSLNPQSTNHYSSFDLRNPRHHPTISNTEPSAIIYPNEEFMTKYDAMLTYAGLKKDQIHFNFQTFIIHGNKSQRRKRLIRSIKANLIRFAIIFIAGNQGRKVISKASARVNLHLAKASLLSDFSHCWRYP